jgi:hypothetical protein
MGSGIPLLVLWEPGIWVTVGVVKPVGASVAVCCATRPAIIKQPKPIAYTRVNVFCVMEKLLSSEDLPAGGNIPA